MTRHTGERAGHDFLVLSMGAVPAVSLATHLQHIVSIETTGVFAINRLKRGKKTSKVLIPQRRKRKLKITKRPVPPPG